MADIDFYQEDGEDAQDYGDDLGLDSDGSNPDEGLTPIQRLEKYMDSENIFSRQMVARSILETLRVVGDNEEEANLVLEVMVKVANDPEPTVRAELMEQIPHLAVYCHENLDLFKDPVPTYILPTVVKYLTDMNNQVRKTSQAALLVLLEQDLVDKKDVEEQVCPVILDLSSPDSMDDFRTEAVALMSKMAPLIGKDVTTRLFLARFCQMCTDSLFHVRKVCAANFGEMCGVVGQESTEAKLLSRFESLCEDGVWGVRKACAECFMAVSYSCSQDVRRNELANLFISLICDQSRWVRMSAFQALGGFISTFADPGVTGLYFDEDGVLNAGNPEDFPKDGSSEYTEEIPITDGDVEPVKVNPPEVKSSIEPMDLTEDSPESFNSVGANQGGGDGPSPAVVVSSSSDVSVEELRAAKYLPHNPENNNVKVDSSGDSIEAEANKNVNNSEEEGEKDFNSFLYWRTPLPEIDIELDIVKEKAASNTSGEKTPPEDKSVDDFFSRKLDNLYLVDLPTEGDEAKATPVGSSATKAEDAQPGLNIMLSSSLNVPFADSDTDSDDLSRTPSQNVVPQALLEHYLSMIDPARAQTVDTEIARHCAYTLPAVAYTLGRKHWPCLKHLYETLATDMQWKVRRTLAFSIHELAVILGEDITTKDLVPVFDGLLKDLDEVRSGILKHLSDFLRFLKPEIRKQYLDRLGEFLSMDNCRNWRFREDLAQQLLLMLDLYSPADVRDYLVPVAMTLAQDKVNEVRQTAMEVLSAMLRHLSLEGDGVLVSTFLSDILEKFTGNQTWCRRRTFAQFCHYILAQKAVSNEQFATDLLPTLLKLGHDPIPNVKLSLSKTLARDVLTSEYFTSAQNPHHQDLLETIQILQTDSDRDVRYFINHQPSLCEETTHLDDTIPV